MSARLLVLFLWSTVFFPSVCSRSVTNIFCSLVQRSLCFSLQLYELSDDQKRKEFLDDLFAFMQKRGKIFVLIHLKFVFGNTRTFFQPESHNIVLQVPEFRAIKRFFECTKHFEGRKVFAVLEPPRICACTRARKDIKTKFNSSLNILPCSRWPVYVLKLFNADPEFLSAHSLHA